MNRSPLAAALILALASLAATPAAQAALPFGSLSFVTPTGSATSDETIEVFMRLTLDTASAPLEFTSDPLTGFDPADLPTQGNFFDPVTGIPELRDFESITGALLNTYYVCSGNFTASDCGPGSSYSFEFWFASEPGRPSIIGASSFSLAPGASTEFLLGRFIPMAGGADPGTYSFYTAGVTLSFWGLGALGETLFSTGVDLASSCPTATEDCAFTRTVSAVPEPATYALWLAGLASMGFVARRRALQ